MLSQRIKYAMAHLSRKQYMSLLARPNWRRLRRTDMNIVSNPNAISRAALKCRASKRISIMAQPKRRTRKYDSLRVAPPYQRIHPKTLEAKASRRIVELAVPKARKMVAMEHRRVPSRPRDIQRHMEIIEKLATPKRVHKRKPFIPKKKWRPVNMRRLANLAEPVSREMPESRDLFRVAEAAMKYVPTARMRKLMEVPEREIPPPLIPGAVSRAALKAVATPRTVDLAKPLARPAGMETDLREDAFTVSPIALKAKCSRRLRRLARPRNVRAKRKL